MFVLLLLAGLWAGAQNALAGGGSFITPASTFLVAPAERTASPATVRADSIRNPMPPPK